PPFPPGCCATPGPSGPSPAPSSAHRTPGATDNTSPRSRRSGGLRPPCSGPERPEHLSAATWRRSLQACIASLPLQSSLMSKTYLKSDHFNGGGAVDSVGIMPNPSNQMTSAVTSLHHADMASMTPTPPAALGPKEVETYHGRSPAVLVDVIGKRCRLVKCIAGDTFGSRCRRSTAAS